MFTTLFICFSSAVFVLPLCDQCLLERKQSTHLSVAVAIYNGHKETLKRRKISVGAKSSENKRHIQFDDHNNLSNVILI